MTIPPSDEIEVTPEMVTAGLVGLFGYDPESAAEDAVIEIYRLMEEARLRRVAQ